MTAGPVLHGYRSPATRWTCSAAAGAVLGAALLVNQSAVHWRPNAVDSYLFAWHGWCVANGAVPYTDVWDNKPPGIWWANALAIRLLGPGFHADLALGTTALIVSFASFLGVAATLHGRVMLWLALPTACVLLTHLSYECGANRTETFVTAFETLAVLGYVRWLTTRRVGWLVLAGAAAGVAPWFKQTGIAVSLACGLHQAWLCLGHRRATPAAWLMAASAFLCVQLVSLGTLAAQGALAEAYLAVGPFNRAYFAVGEARPWPTGVAWRGSIERVQPVALLLIVAMVGLGWRLLSLLAGRVRRTDEQTGSSATGLLWLWFLLALYFACVGPGRQGHHFMPILSPLGLLAIEPFGRALRSASFSARVAASPRLAMFAVAYLALLVDLAGNSLVRAVDWWRGKSAWYALAYHTPTEEQQRAAEIVRITRPEERIYVWGWSPGTYRFSCRRSASRFATLEKAGQVGEHAEFLVRGAMRDIQRDPPAVFIISLADRPALHETRPEFAAWVREHYVDHALIGGMYLLTKRDKWQGDVGAANGSQEQPPTSVGP